MYYELVQGIPPIFSHLIGSIPSIYSIVVFVSIKDIVVSSVESEDRFLFRQVEPRVYKVFQCVVRHGYNDVLEDPAEFESQLIKNLKAYVQEENYFTVEVSESATEQTVVVESSDKRETHNFSNTIITNQSASTSSNSI